MTGRLFAVAAGVIAAVGSEYGRSTLILTVPLMALVIFMGDISLVPERPRR